jgi:hypothetical protein
MSARTTSDGPGRPDLTPSPPTAIPVPDAPVPGATAHGGEPQPTITGRLSSALRSPLAGASSRLGRLVPGGDASRGSGRRTADEAAAYQEAVRQAFLSADSIVPARPTRRPRGKPEATLPPEANAVNAVAVEPVLHVRPARLPAATPADDVRPAVLEAAVPTAAVPTADLPEADLPEAPRAQLHAAVLAAATVGDAPVADAPAGGPPAISPLPGGTRSPGRATTDDLLQVPGSVTTTADDFFGGLIRRVERRP